MFRGENCTAFRIMQNIVIADHFCMGPDDPNLEIYREIGMIPAYDGFTIDI